LCHFDWAGDGLPAIPDVKGDQGLDAQQSAEIGFYLLKDYAFGFAQRQPRIPFALMLRRRHHTTDATEKHVLVVKERFALERSQETDSFIITIDKHIAKSCFCEDILGHNVGRPKQFLFPLDNGVE
jgi:hypothetical protein